MTTRIKPRFLAIGLVLALVAIGAFTSIAWMRPPAELDLSTQLATAQGHFQVAYTSSATPLPINQLHTWAVQVTTPDGQPVEGARITVDGDMPQHGHGLPTRPQVTHELSPGTYLVEGMKFQMGGWWVVDVTIDANDTSDSVRFNLAI